MSQEHSDFSIEILKNGAISTGEVLALALLLYLIKPELRLSMSNVIMIVSAAFLVGAIPGAALESSDNPDLGYGFTAAVSIFTFFTLAAATKMSCGKSSCCNKEESHSDIEANPAEEQADQTENSTLIP